MNTCMYNSVRAKKCREPTVCIFHFYWQKNTEHGNVAWPKKYQTLRWSHVVRLVYICWSFLKIHVFDRIFSSKNEQKNLQNIHAFSALFQVHPQFREKYRTTSTFCQFCSSRKIAERPEICSIWYFFFSEA